MRFAKVGMWRQLLCKMVLGCIHIAWVVVALVYTMVLGATQCLGWTCFMILDCLLAKTIFNLHPSLINKTEPLQGVLNKSLSQGTCLLWAAL